MRLSSFELPRSISRLAHVPVFAGPTPPPPAGLAWPPPPPLGVRCLFVCSQAGIGSPPDASSSRQPRLGQPGCQQRCCSRDGPSETGIGCSVKCHRGKEYLNQTKQKAWGNFREAAKGGREAREPGPNYKVCRSPQLYAAHEQITTMATDSGGHVHGRQGSPVPAHAMFTSLLSFTSCN